MGAWSADSKTRVASMTEGDFYGSEKSITVAEATQFKIEFVAEDGAVTELKGLSALKAGEVIDSSALSLSALKVFVAKEIIATRAEGTLLSAHLKATMMKVSDPLIFGAIVEVYFADVFTKYADLFKELNLSLIHI